MPRTEREPKAYKFPGFKACMEMMRRRSPEVQEDGFHFLLPHAAEYFAELVAEFHIETDPGLRCWLMELIGEAKHPNAYLFLIESLADESDSVRMWALAGLRKLDTKEARTFLWTSQAER